jgi:L-ribulokinase
MIRESGVPVERFIATGGLPHHNPLAVQVYADVLGEPITVHPSKQGSALGAAILGALAANVFETPQQAILAMATPGEGTAAVFHPNLHHHALYSAIYREYRRLGAFFSGHQQ